MNQKLLLFLGLMTVFTFALAPVHSMAADDTQGLLDFLQREAEPPAPLLPPDVTVVDGFEAGVGAPVGEAQMVQGTVLVIHKDTKDAYKLKKTMKVFNGDTLITRTKSRVSMLMYDKSALTLTGQSKLVIDRSMYDPKNNTRDSEMELLFGKVRCVVKKINSTPNYTVKTPTAVAGVRGTDFALATDGETTGIVTGNNSTLSFQRPNTPPVTIPSNSVASAPINAAITPPANVGSASVQTLEAIAPDTAVMSMPPEFE